jgi:hypothetical protein
MGVYLIIIGIIGIIFNTAATAAYYFKMRKKNEYMFITWRGAGSGPRTVVLKEKDKVSFRSNNFRAPR